MSVRTQRIVLTLGSLATTLMLVLLALNLVDIERQRRIAARQEQRVKSLAGESGPDLSELRRQLSRGVDGAAKGLPPVKAGLRRADRLVRAFLEEGSPEAIAAAGRLARLAPPDLQSLVRLSSELLDVTRSTRDIAADTAQDADVLRQQTTDFKRESLAIQRETLAILRESLAVQRETLEHTRRIDERLGGALDPTTR